MEGIESVAITKAQHDNIVCKLQDCYWLVPVELKDKMPTILRQVVQVLDSCLEKKDESNS